MSTSNNKLLYSSKPTIWYYLLALFFPTMFFLVDDSKQIVFEKWEPSIKTYVINIFGFLIFWGVPILMLTLRREVRIYADKLELYKPTFNLLKTYNFADLEMWRVSDIYVYRAGRQINLTMKFRGKKITLNKIELGAYDKLVSILETKYSDKKKT